MATDFGDESGERLFDWMLEVGREAGQEALAKSAKGFQEPCSFLRLFPKLMRLFDSAVMAMDQSGIVLKIEGFKLAKWAILKTRSLNHGNHLAFITSSVLVIAIINEVINGWPIASPGR